MLSLLDSRLELFDLPSNDTRVFRCVSSVNLHSTLSVNALYKETGLRLNLFVENCSVVKNINALLSLDKLKITTGNTRKVEYSQMSWWF